MEEIIKQLQEQKAKLHQQRNKILENMNLIQQQLENINRAILKAEGGIEALQELKQKEANKTDA